LAQDQVFSPTSAAINIMSARTMSGASGDIVPVDALGRPRLSALTSPRQVVMTPRQAMMPHQAASPDLKQLQQVTELHCRKLVKMESTLGSIEERLAPQKAFICELNAHNTVSNSNITLESLRWAMERDLAYLRDELEAKLAKFNDKFERIRAEVSKATANQAELKRLREGLQIFWGELDQKCCTRTDALREDLGKDVAKLLDEVSWLKDGHTIVSLQSRLQSLEERLSSLQKIPSECLHDSGAMPVQLAALHKTLEQQAASLQCSEAALAAAVRRVDALEFTMGSSSGGQDAPKVQAAPGLARAVNNYLTGSPRDYCTAVGSRDVKLHHSGTSSAGQQKEAGSEPPEQTAEGAESARPDNHTIIGSPSAVRGIWQVSGGAQEAALEVQGRSLTAIFDQMKRSHQSQTMLTQESVAAADTALSTGLNCIRGLSPESKGQARCIQVDEQRQVQVMSTPTSQCSAGQLCAKPQQVLAATALETSALQQVSTSPLHGRQMQTSGDAAQCTASRLLTLRRPGPVEGPPSSPTSMLATSSEHQDSVRQASVCLTPLNLQALQVVPCDEQSPRSSLPSRSLVACNAPVPVFTALVNSPCTRSNSASTESLNRPSTPV